MANILGIDAGLLLTRPTSGICRTGTAGFKVGHTYIDKLSRGQLLSSTEQFDCLGIDAPVLPKNILNYDRRAVESLFMRGAFQKRCKPGASHVAGTGRALRRSGCDTAMQFAAETRSRNPVHYPRVQADQNIVEAFPNAFLSVMLDLQHLSAGAAFWRGQKTDKLFSLSNAHGAFQALEQHLVWQDAAFWSAFTTIRHHDELAALVCAATALCAHLGKYVAVGDVEGGYFFLPPWTLWKSWAKQALQAARQKPELRPVVQVWIDGRAYGANDQLP